LVRFVLYKESPPDQAVSLGKAKSLQEFVISLRRGRSLADLPDHASSLEAFLVREKIAIKTVMPTGTTVVVSLSDKDKDRFQQRYGNTVHVVDRVKGHVL